MGYDVNQALQDGYSVKEVSNYLKFDYDKAIKDGYTDDEITAFLMMDREQPVTEWEKPLEWGDVPLEAVKNIPGSAWEFGKNIYQAVRHPVKTVKVLGKVAVGGVQKAIPGEQKQEKYFNATMDFFKERYGGEENLKQTIATDPVGFLTDVSAVLGGAGIVVSGVGKVSKVSAVSKVAERTGKVGRIVDPLATVGEALKAKTAVNSAVKTVLQFSKKESVFKVDDLANAFMAKGLNVTRSSLKSLDKKIAKIKNKINKIIDEKTATGIKIKTDDIVKSLDELTEDAARQGLELSDIKIIEKLKNQFREMHGAELTPRQVQDIKVGLNKGFKGNLNEKFGQIRAKVRDKIRFEAKTKLEELNPELKYLNKDEGVMIELRKAINTAINEFEKRPTFESKGLMAGGIAGGVVGGVVGVQMGDPLLGLAFAGVSALTVKVLVNPKVSIAFAKAIRLAKIRAIQGTRYGTRPAFQAGRLEKLITEE